MVILDPIQAYVGANINMNNANKMNNIRNRAMGVVNAEIIYN